MARRQGSFLALASLLLPALTSGPVQAEEKIATVLAAGDISSCSKSGARDAQAVAALIRKTIAENPQDKVLVLALGDLAYKSGRKDDFKCFAKNWQGFEDLLLPVPGNHEYQAKKDAAPYFDHFKDNRFVHQNDQVADKAKDKRWNMKGYFSHTVGSSQQWQIIGINNYLSKNDRKAQTAWLAKALESPSKCVLAMWHAPLFTSGRHGHEDYTHTKANAKLDPEAGLSHRYEEIERTFDLLYRRGASIVLNGHEHSYEQFKPQDAKGQQVSDGIRQFTVGTGGSELTEDFYTNLEPNSEHGVFGKDKGAQGILKIDLFDGYYRWSFLAVEGEDGKPAANIPVAPGEAKCNSRK